MNIVGINLLIKQRQVNGYNQNVWTAIFNGGGSVIIIYAVELNTSFFINCVAKQNRCII